MLVSHPPLFFCACNNYIIINSVVNIVLETSALKEIKYKLAYIIKNNLENVLPHTSLLTYFPLCMICSIGWSTVFVVITRVKSLGIPICFLNCAVQQARSSLCSKIHLLCDYLGHYVIAVICKAYSNLSDLIMMRS